eukprot:CAMPEP_0171176660 /NCGR_PEP_ID=MMETSP0790-20130122/11848_1 /TAXON_ID=2925 /ORGANISM="Alexandrium catenella, Strain OF101" /LENGTH=189 /DNA_ID=CAMNT_0011641553 /DNA_START=76 /DNA_END=643 /DNA_ORIENTATION=+
MAPKAKAQGKAKGKAKAKAASPKKAEAASPKKAATMEVKGGTGLDLGAVDDILAKWSEAKKKEDAAKKEIEACKTEVEATLMKTGMTAIKTASFEVSKRQQSRESVSKADLPADVWKRYAKTSEFSVLALKELKRKRAAAAGGAPPGPSTGAAHDRLALSCREVALERAPVCTQTEACLGDCFGGAFKT